MRKYTILILLVITSFRSSAQCLVSSLTINTGYDPLTGLAITPGINGGAPVIDPHWIVSSEAPAIATALTAMGTGLIEVTPGSSADIVTTFGGWVSNPFGNPGGYLSCVNSNTYNTDGTGPTGTVYNEKMSRSFRMCSDDTVVIDFQISVDNYISVTDIDGTVLGFTQSATPSASHFAAFEHYTQRIFLTAGTHTLSFVVNNYNDPETTPPEINPSGMDLYGTVSSATGSSSLVSESFASCTGFSCSSVCNAISMPDTLHPCAATSLVIPAVLIGTDSVLSISWTPPAFLSDTSILDPTIAVPTSSRWYYLTVRSLLPYNFVVNGDFSAGNTGFSSNYIYSPPPSTTLVEGDYSVDTNPHDVHTGFTTFGDHTTGTGEMMILNGGPTPTSVWCETIPVNPNTDYDFSAWVANCSSVTTGADVPLMQFKINGILIGTATSITSAPGVWNNFFNVWNSGTSTTATICIYDANTTASGNDFVLDDISFKEICVAKDSVYIEVNAADTTFTSMDTTLCTSVGAITLAGPGGIYNTYLWNTGATSSTISVGTTGTYWVYASGNCVAQLDTFHVTYITNPAPNLGNDTTICLGSSVVLHSGLPATDTLLWSDGSTGDSITVTTSGTYTLTAHNGCAGTDDIHIQVSPYPLVNLGPDTLDCNGAPIMLQSAYTYDTTATYLWSNGIVTVSDTASLTGTYWLQVTVAGCAAADTINVAILYDTLNLFTPDTAICRGQSVQVFANGNPAQTYQWTPTAGIPFSTSLQPLISPDTSALYILRASMPFCPVIVKSFYLDVQPVPDVYIGGNRFVCEFDTVHIPGMVAPAWYNHYAYSWAPTAYLDDSTQATVVFTGGQSTQIVLTVTTPAGCKGIDSANIIVHPGNFAALDTNLVICPHDSVQLTPTGGVSYTWHPGIYLSDSLSSAPWAHNITNVLYTGIAVSEYGCLDTVHANVTVQAAAVMDIPDSVTLHPGETYQVPAQTNCTSFTWFPPIGLSDAHSSNPLITSDISTSYTVTATTEWGCKTTASINVVNDPETLLALPNAFTPGSGVNGVLTILKNGVATLNYFRIYNRWGNVVYESTNIDAGWDGDYKGKPQPFDVYVYEIEAVTSTGKVFHKRGNVTLLR